MTYRRTADNKAAIENPVRTCWDPAKRLPAAPPEETAVLALAVVDEEAVDPTTVEVAATAVAVDPDAEVL